MMTACSALMRELLGRSRDLGNLCSSMAYSCPSMRTTINITTITAHGHGRRGHGHAFAIGTALNTGFVAANWYSALPADSMHYWQMRRITSAMCWGCCSAGARPGSAACHPAPAPVAGAAVAILAALLNARDPADRRRRDRRGGAAAADAPQPVTEITVILVATGRIVVNGATALCSCAAAAATSTSRAVRAHGG